MCIRCVSPPAKKRWWRARERRKARSASASAFVSTPPRRGIWRSGTPACARIAPWSSRCSITRGSGRGSPARNRTGAASRDLLLWNFCPLHHPGPALGFADEELAQLLGRAGAALDAELGETLLHFGRRQRTHHRPVEALDDRARS